MHMNTSRKGLKVHEYKILDLFSGIGGFSLGFENAGPFRTIAFCEQDEFAQSILKKHWPSVPIYEDVRTLRTEELGEVDIICGGFPCQDLSTSGKRSGLEGERSGLWSEIIRMARETHPGFIVVENVANLLVGPSEQPGRWFGRVLSDLAEIGYDAEWHCICASAMGAVHHRDRVWIIAYPSGDRRCGSGPLLNQITTQSGTLWPSEASFWNACREWDGNLGDLPDLREDDGISLAAYRLKALGNSICVPIATEIGKAILESERQ